MATILNKVTPDIYILGIVCVAFYDLDYKALSKTK